MASVMRFDARSLLLLTAVVAVGLVWWQDRQQLERRIGVLEARMNPSPLLGASWDAAQATGAPNTDTAGDRPTAWASATQDGQPEWLELTYAKSITPYQVEVHESFNPGAVRKVSAIDHAGKEVVIWEGTDPTPTSAKMGVSKILLDRSPKTNRIRIYLASDSVSGWNEIDAVGLRYGWFGQIIWAQHAEASSTYGGYGMFGGYLR